MRYWYKTECFGIWNETDDRPAVNRPWVIEKSGTVYWLYKDWDPKIGNPGFKKFDDILDAMICGNEFNSGPVAKVPVPTKPKDITATEIVEKWYAGIKQHRLADKDSATECKQAAPKKKGNKPMCYECDCDYDDDCCSTDTVTEKKVSYLKGRAYRIRDDKQTELRKKFSMDADAAPKTVEEMLERIKEGRYTVLEEAKRPYWQAPYQNLIWRDPKVPADPVGYEAAIKELDKEYQKLMDTIMIAEAPEALKAVQEFEET